MTNSMRFRRFFAVLAATTFVSALQAETLADVEKQVTELTKNVRALTADVRVTTTMPDDRGRTVNEAKIEELIEGNRFLSNRYGKTEKITKEGDKEKHETMEYLYVCDGQIQWQQEELLGRQVVFKRRPDAGPSFGGRLFSELKKGYKLSLNPEERVGEQPCWVIIATPLVPAAENQPEIGKAVYYIRKRDGLVAKTEVYLGGWTKPTSVTLFSNLNPEAKLTSDRFTYKVPDGFHLIDETVETPQTGG